MKYKYIYLIRKVELIRYIFSFSGTKLQNYLLSRLEGDDKH